MLKTMGVMACLALMPAWAIAGQAPAQSSPAEPVPTLELAQSEEGRILDTVQVVAGNQPGPRMWKVRKGDHVLYVLATVSPLPRGVTWDSAQVEGVIARSQEYIRPPYLGISADVGWISGMRLLPAYLRAKKNPGGATLQQVLPPELYAHWREAKARYLPNDKSVEKQRPIMAAETLYQAALKQSGLGGKPKVTPVVDAAVKRHKLKTVSTAIQIKIKDPKQALQELQAGRFDDAQCLRETLDNIERKLPDVARQANAWAMGDVAELRTRPTQKRPSCLDATLESDFARKRGISDVPQRMRSNWVKAAEDALSRNASTFAVLPLELVAGPDNYLDTMRAKGFEVTAP
ncbi:MAG: TraB/GumN family protein [Xanthomonadaceae bacterium]|nr:TraB/GumN family protein [Xanthomonadaceae bacterium]